MDLACAAVVFALTALLGAAYAVHRLRSGAAEFSRVDKDGSSALLGKGAKNATYWGLQPIGRACVKIGVSANAVSLASLFFSAVTGVALAFGHFGVAALATAFASLGDALDGLVAREAGTASDAGEVLDAAVDRYAEFFFLAGLAVHYREDTWALVIVLFALLGSFMVSYSTAKAEALHVDPPRGAMRRVERAVYLGVGALLVPVVAPFLARASAPAWTHEVTMLAALTLVALVGNVSAARRLAAVARAVDRGAK